jgi:hypothetical protein
VVSSTTVERTVDVVHLDETGGVAAPIGPVVVLVDGTRIGSGA